MILALGAGRNASDRCPASIVLAELDWKGIRMVNISPLVTGFRQVCVVVRDCDDTIRQFVEKAGIGPWAVWTYGPHNLTNMRLRGQPVEYSMRLAIAWSKEQTWEVIQPLGGPSIYQEFLDATEGGIHHVLVQHCAHDFNAALERFTRRGCPPLMEGHMAGTNVDFAYIETDGPLKMTMEISNRPRDFRRAPPDYWYPHPLEEFPDTRTDDILDDLDSVVAE